MPEYKMRNDVLTKFFKMLIYTAKSERPDEVTFHLLRHSFISHLVMKGVDLPAVMKLAGHTQLKTTQRYAHFAKEHLETAASKVRF